MNPEFILAIDPGAKPGFALVQASQIPGGPAWSLNFATNSPQAAREAVHAVGRAPALAVVMETPVIRPGGKSRPNDIVRLALTAGGLARFVVPPEIRVACVEPTTWKGAVKKEIHQSRVRARIEAGYFANARMSLEIWDHVNTDVRDAIAIAIWRTDPDHYHPFLTFDLEPWRKQKQ